MNEEISTSETIASAPAENADKEVDLNAIAAEVLTGEKPKETKAEKEKTTDGEGDEAFVADDSLIERAVKAGLSVADAKGFTSAEQADRILKALEAKKEVSTTETREGTDNGGEGFPADDLDKVLKGIKDDGDYSPEFVKMFEGLTSLLKSQQQEIAALKKAGASAETKSEFDARFDGLDKGVRDHVDAATKSQLKAKFDFLKSAHESAKDGAKAEEIFDEAKKLVLGDIISKASEEDKAAALEKRRSLVLARPGGQSGTRGNGAPMTEAEIANVLFEAMTK